MNRKRVLRIYREERLALRKKPRKKLVAAAPRERSLVPDLPHRRWSMDFMRDTLNDGRAFRALNILDDGSRECLASEVDLALPAERVVRVLDRLAQERPLPAEIVVDNGPEFVSHALDNWAAKRGVTLRFIRPGRPVENCFTESFNGTMRRECLDATGLRISVMPGASSRAGGATTTTTGRTAASVTSRRRSLQPSAPRPPNPLAAGCKLQEKRYREGIRPGLSCSDWTEEGYGLTLSIFVNIDIASYW